MGSVKVGRGKMGRTRSARAPEERGELWGQTHTVKRYAAEYYWLLT
jgi:hypothetical protein